jgi:hypothetical protein
MISSQFFADATKAFQLRAQGRRHRASLASSSSVQRAEAQANFLHEHLRLLPCREMAAFRKAVVVASAQIGKLRFRHMHTKWKIAALSLPAGGATSVTDCVVSANASWLNEAAATNAAAHQ